MKPQIRIAWLLLIRTLIIALLASACSDVKVSTTPYSDAQTVFSISQNPEKDDPTSFINIDWSQADKITIRGLWLEKYPIFIGEIDTGKVFPFYMDNSVVLGSPPVISDKGNYLAFQTNRKLYIALMDKVASNRYLISRESIVSVFEAPSRCNLAWSPNSQQLASVCLAFDGVKISLYNLSNDEPQEVFQYFEKNIDEIEGASWSSDANALAFSLRYRYDDENNKKSQKDVFIYRFDTQAFLRVTNSPDSSEQDPDWYPGTRTLTFTTTKEGDAQSIESRLVFSTDDGKCKKQVPNIKGIISPSWSPDGNQLAYISEWESIRIIERSKFIPSDFLTPQGLCDESK